jgi:hypothetical protein
MRWAFPFGKKLGAYRRKITRKVISSSFSLVYLASMKIVWRADTHSAFDVVVTDKGSPLSDGTWTFGGFGEIFSPFGRWKVTSGDNGVWDLLQQKWTVLNGGGGVTFTVPPGIFLQYTTFHSGFVNSDIVWYVGNAARQGQWNGEMTFRVIMTDPADPFTWIWVTRYFGSGPAL